MKKLNKFFAVLVALAMMATLCVSMAFAEEANPAITGGTTANKIDATLTKTLVMPNGLTDPAKAYNFTFVQSKQTGEDTDGYVDTDTPVSVNAITPATETLADDEGTLVGKTEKIFADINWQTPGVYEYTVTEVFPKASDFAGYTAVDEEHPNVLVNEAGTSKITLDATAKTVTIETKSNPIQGTDPVEYKTTTTEVFDYSQAEYKVYVGVASDGDDLYIESIAVKKTRNDDGQEQSPAPKVPANNPQNGEANGFNFKNEYNKTVNNKPTGTTPDGPGAIDGDSLFIEKKIELKDNKGTVDTAKEFRMNVTVNFPTNGTKTSYTAQRVDAMGNKVEGTEDVAFTKQDNTKTVSLRTGERLVFTDIEYGASYTVAEDSYPAYAPSYAAKNIAEGKDITKDAVLIYDDKDNGTVVTNTYDETKNPETGLSIANLPFIVLALVAVGGLVAYVVVRRKSEDNA